MRIEDFRPLVFSIILAILSSAVLAQTSAVTRTDTIQVNVDNHTIFLYSKGKGMHTIVMEAGLGASHNCWRAVDNALSANARVITYDRPGYLSSDSCQKTRDAVTVAQELRQALQKAGVNPPYVLVGWSLGGSFARVFCGLFPDDVKGLVLVDPAPEESYARFEKESPEAMQEDSFYFKEVFSSSRIGEKAELHAFSMSMDQARKSDGKYTIPGILLIATHGKGFGRYVNDPGNIVNRIWAEELVKWANKNPTINYRLVESGHHIAKERPEIVINAVLELMK